MRTFFRALIVGSLALAGIVVPGIASAGANRLVATGPWDGADGCIRYQTTLTSAPSVKGDQFVVRRGSADAGVATRVADLIRDYNGHNIISTYEKGLGLSSLLQPGQPGPFPVFIEHGALQAEGMDGVFAHVCYHPSWGSLVVDGTIADPQELDDTVAHELFHAAQFALLRELTTSANWWFEATATAAESWFGATPDETTYETALVNNPGTPMDSFVYLDPHQYGAFLFVQWLLKTAGQPSPQNWTFLKDSFEDVHSLGPTRGVEAALSPLKEKLGDKVASFWADHTNQVPKFGPRGKINSVPVGQPYQQFTAHPATPLGARLFALVPDQKVQQIEVRFENLPQDVELWINLGGGSLAEVKPGETFDETFCRSGYLTGNYPLPKTGDIRLALTTTGKSAPGSFKWDVLTSTKPCPKQILIVPGLDVGQLHLAMTEAEANSAATLVNTHTYTVPGIGTIDNSLYQEGPTAWVGANFYQDRAVTLAAVGLNFITTTGVEAGSTEAQFTHSGTGVACTPVGHNPNNNVACYYESPKTRVTWAFVHNYECPSQGPCPPPGPGWHVVGLGVATKQAFDYLLASGLLQP